LAILASLSVGISDIWSIALVLKPNFLLIALQENFGPIVLLHPMQCSNFHHYPFRWLASVGCAGFHHQMDIQEGLVFGNR
jgi:hypothetical protein